MGTCRAIQLRRVDDRPLLLRPPGPRRRGGRLRLDDRAGQHLLSAARRQPVPVQPRRQPGVSRGQALPRAVLADPCARRGHQPPEVRHVRPQAAGPRPGAGRQAGHVDGGADRRPARPRHRSQPVAGRLRGARRGLGQPGAADGRVDRHPARPGGRRLLRVPRQGLRPAAGQDRPGAARPDSRSHRRSFGRRAPPRRPAGRRLATRRGRPGRPARPAQPGSPGSAARKARATARSRCT